MTNGVTGAFHAAVMALLNPGDEVLLFEPFYGYHVSTLRSIRAVPVPVALAGSGLDTGCGCGAGGGYSEDAGDGDQYAVESGGEGVYAEELEALAEIAGSSICLCLRMRSMSTLFMAMRSM